MRNLLMASLFFIILNTVRAQEYDSLRSIYVREFPDKFNLKLLATDRLLILNLRAKDHGNRTINYSPNNRGYIGIGAYIFDIGLELAVKVPEAFERSETKYGKTRFLDFQGNIYGRKWCFDGTFQQYKGFFISNPSSVFPDFDSGADFPQRPDLAIANIIVNGIHIFNHEKFSFRSGFNQADRQIKSAGSPVLLLSTAFFSINADSLLIPERHSLSFGEASRFQEGDFFTFSVLPGYAYNFVVKNFFINVNATAGAGIQLQKFVAATEQKQWALEPKINFRAALGYDNDRFFAGGSFLIQKSRTNIDGMSIDNTAGNFKFFLGYRFEEFGILKKHSIRDINIF